MCFNVFPQHHRVVSVCVDDKKVADGVAFLESYDACNVLLVFQEKKECHSHFKWKMCIQSSPKCLACL